MFLKNSRYFGLPTVTAHDRSGDEVVAVKLRRLPTVQGDPLVVEGHDRLDVICDLQYDDATRYWHIADANTELEANELVRVAGRTIALPKA
jgi:hypothetical protein